MTLKPLQMTDQERELIKAMPVQYNEFFDDEDEALQDRDDLNIAVEEHYEAYLEQRAER